MFLEGQIIEFLDGDQLKPGYVRKQERDRLQVIDPRGRHISVNGDRVAVIHGAVSEAEYPSTVKRTLERVQERESEIDVELLWQSVGSGVREYLTQELAELFFAESTPVGASAMFHALSRDGLFFKRTGLRFLPKTSEQVAAEQLRRVRQREREESRERLGSAVKRLMRGAAPTSGSAAASAEDLEFALQRIHTWLLHRNGDEVGALLEEMAAPVTAREAAYDILLRAGRFDESADRFLTIAGIEDRFTSAVAEAGAAIVLGDLEGEHLSGAREDWRSVPALSIDDEDTVEIDDALTVRTEDGLLVVGIHIADAAAFVARGDVLDIEARRRTATVYLPTISARMFPDPLATDISSLRRGVDRPAFTLEARFDAEGNLLQHRFVRTVIRVEERLTYESADALIEAGDSRLEPLHRVAVALQQARGAKGAILYRRPEVKVRVRRDRDGERIVVTKQDPGSPSRVLVSEMMVLCNSLAADLAAAQGIPVLFRTQEPRDPAPPDAAGLPEALAFDKLKRTFKRSRLSTAPGVHSGLGLSAYSQVSSPIRRYADLIAQRQIGAALRGGQPPHTREELQEIAATVESAESEMRQLEERANTYWLFQYLAREKAEASLRAVVLDRKGLVELDDFNVRGRLADPGAAEPGSAIEVLIERIDPVRGEIRLKRA